MRRSKHDWLYTEQSAYVYILFHTGFTLLWLFVFSPLASTYLCGAEIYTEMDTDPVVNTHIQNDYFSLVLPETLTYD